MKQNNSQIKGWAVALTVFLIIALAIVGCVFNNSFVKKTDDHSIQKENSDNTTTTVSVPADTNDSIPDNKTSEQTDSKTSLDSKSTSQSTDADDSSSDQNINNYGPVKGQTIIKDNPGTINITIP